MHTQAHKCSHTCTDMHTQTHSHTQTHTDSHTLIPSRTRSPVKDGGGGALHSRAHPRTMKYDASHQSSFSSLAPSDSELVLTTVQSCSPVLESVVQLMNA